MKTLALPSALIFVLGLALVYYGLRGLDKKHGILGHALGAASTSTGGGGGSGGPPSPAPGSGIA